MMKSLTRWPLTMVMIVGLLLALNMLNVVAQEATEEPTAEVTAEPTIEPTVEATQELTSEPTAEATTEPTAEPTVEVTTEPTVEVTAEPTTPPTPLPDGLFVDDFADGDTLGWELAGWSLADDSGNVVLMSGQPGATAAITSVDWPHLLLAARVRLAEGSSVSVNLRGSVSLRLEASGQASLLVNGAVVAQGEPVASADGWRQLNIQALGQSVTVAVERAVQFSYTDASLPTSSGTLSFTNEAGLVALDDLMVNRLDAPEVIVTEAPTEAPTTEPTVEATPAQPAIALDPPNPPQLKAPKNETIITNTRPKLTWQKSPGARRYRVDLATDEAFSAPLLTDHQTNRPSLALNGSVLADELPPGIYYWRVQAGNKAGEWSGESAIYSFVVNLQRTPKDNTFTTNRRITFGWTKTREALRYRLLIDDNSDFSSPLVDMTTPNNRTVRYRPPANAPLPIGNLFWRVDVEYGSGWVESSQAFRLTVTPKPLNPPTPNTPANKAFTNDSTPTLSWSAVTDPGGEAVAYEVQVSSKGNFKTVIMSINTNLTSFEAMTPLPSDGRYYWRVRTLNHLGAPGKWSRKFQFTLDTTAPAPPTLKTPRDGSSTSKSPIVFKWRKGSSDSQTYEIRWGTDNPPDGAPIVNAGRKSNYRLTTALLPATYYWQVRATDRAGNVSAWSAPFSLIVASPNNAVPVLNRYDTSQPTFTWTPISWAEGYQLQVALDEGFNTIVYDEDGIADNTTSHQVAEPLADGVYYWRIRASSGPGTWGNWSTVGIFLVLD